MVSIHQISLPQIVVASSIYASPWEISSRRNVQFVDHCIRSLLVLIALMTSAAAAKVTFHDQQQVLYQTLEARTVLTIFVVAVVVVIVVVVVVIIAFPRVSVLTRPVS